MPKVYDTQDSMANSDFTTPAAVQPKDREPKMNDVDSIGPEAKINPADASWKVRARRNAWRVFLHLSYVVGILWTCLHPSFSVLTGEAKCRGWYIDEHALEMNFVPTGLDIPSHLVNLQLPSPESSSDNGSSSYSMCDHFDDVARESSREKHIFRSNTDCLRRSSFHVSRLVPLSSAIEPSEEAIVLVVPGALDWRKSRFHLSMMHLIQQRLPQVPWLAKTILLVAPVNGKNSNLEGAVQDFLDSYLGTSENSTKTQSLPPYFTSALIRALLVLEADDGDKYPELTQSHIPRTTLEIIPQGRRGLLPNMDLVFLVGKMLERASFMNKGRYPYSSTITHPYGAAQRQFVEKTLPKILDHIDLNPVPSHQSWRSKIRRWGTSMSHLVLFSYSMAFGPWQPHAPALDRGIDSLTVRIRFQAGDHFRRNPMIELIQYTEYIIRSLSNLHERLHHSITLYLMPSHNEFVSHVEYLLPTILVLLPCAIRALGTLAIDAPKCRGQYLDVRAVRNGVLVTLASFMTQSTSFAIVSEKSMVFNFLLALPYLVAAVLAFSPVSSMLKSTPNDRRACLISLQFTLCVMAIYLHVPVAFAHASLAYPSALFWSPLLAFPSFLGFEDRWLFRWVIRFIYLAFLVGSMPSILVVPRLVATYTPFVRFLYVPLHAQLSLLVMTMWSY